MTSALPGPVTVTIEPGWDAWRDVARNLLGRAVPPADVQWLPPDSLFGASRPELESAPAGPRVPRAFLDVARRVAHHRSDERCALLYRVLWRLVHAEPHLLEVAFDDDVRQLRAFDAAVRRCVHKTQAFVRFRKMQTPQGPHFVAWYRPEHPILPLVGDFFTDRFSDMRWSISTPESSLHFDGERWHEGPGQPRRSAPTGDELEALWRTYYRSIFNPARMSLRAMKAEMPRRHWSTLPETAEIPDLLAQAAGRVERMLQEQPPEPTVHDLIEATDSLSRLADKSSACTACPLHAPATQTVFGRGDPNARVVLVGEQPGDLEDRRGLPFVGPAGRVLDAILERLGIRRDELYLTNAVKHFNYVPEAKRRLHARPRASHVRACRPWLAAELERIRPDVIVCMGITAARSVLGATVRVQRDRGRPLPGESRIRHLPSVGRAASLGSRSRRGDRARDHLRPRARTALSLGGPNPPSLNRSLRTLASTVGWSRAFSRPCKATPKLSMVDCKPGGKRREKDFPSS